MRISADPAHLVAAHAVRRVALVVARRAALDVAPRGVAVEGARAGQAPSRRMRIERARSRSDALVRVAGLAGADRVAALAGGPGRARVDHVATEGNLPVDEAAIPAIDQPCLDPHPGRPRIAGE